MKGYKLSAQAAALERKHEAQRERRVETKTIIGQGGTALAEWAGVSRQDGTNMRTGQVTYAQASDRLASNNPIGLTATWACVSLIAGTIGSLPLMVYRTDAAGVRTIARDHPLYYLLHDSPNFYLTSLDFWEFMAAGIELQGDAYAPINRSAAGRILSLDPVRPDLMSVRKGAGGLLRYEWTEDGERKSATSDNMLHIRGPFANALGGTSTLGTCRRTFHGAGAAENAAATVFDNGMRPSGVLSTDRSIALTKPQRTELNEHLQENFIGSVNTGRPLVLDRGMTWQQINLSPEDAQMLESRKFSGEEICRLFGVPPAMVGYGDAASNWGTGKEVDVMGFQKFNLRRRCKRIEQSVMKQLLTPADRAAGVTVEFNIEGLLRADSKGRAEVNDIRLKNKSLTINEVRAQDNQPPVPWGDRPWVQMQDVQLNEDGTVPAQSAGDQTI